MKSSITCLVRTIGCCAIAQLIVGNATVFAQNYPAKPVRLIAPFPAGGSSDLIARILAQRMSEGLSHQIIVDNRPGAGSNLGTQLAARTPPDGYTILLTGVPAAINMTLYQKPGFDLVKDFAPISMLAIGPTALVVHPSVPVRNVSQLIKLAQSRPGDLNYGSGGNGTPSHICGEMLRYMAKIKIAHVPYKGTGQSITDLMAGQIQIVFASMPVVFPHMKTGKMRTLGVTGAKRTVLAPDLPTMAESGLLPGYAFDTWWGFVTNAGVSPAIINTLNAETRRALQLPDVKDRFADLGIDIVHGTPAELATFTRSEIDRFATIIRETGIRAD
jgi:tripartite-type tricarboxylate transporter receptor subunit TctC